MPGKWGYIGGGAALLLTGIVAARTDLPARLRGSATPPPVATTAPGPTPTPSTSDLAPMAAAPAPDDGALARLTAALTAREAENTELRTTLAVRDAVLETLQASLADREAALGDLRARLAASEAELATLRHALATFRQARSFDAKLALFQPGAGEPSAARIETVRAEAPDLATTFEAKAPLVPLLALPATAGSVEVHFDFASARLTPGGQAHTAVAAVTLAEMSLAAVRVIGHTDRVGSPAANRRLAARRARTVADALVAAGIPPGLIEIDDKGEADPPIATDDGVPEPLNRTVAIIPVPQPTG